MEQVLEAEGVQRSQIRTETGIAVLEIMGLGLSLVSPFGTAAIAADAADDPIVMFEALPGVAVGLGLTNHRTRCVGLGDYGQTKYLHGKWTLSYRLKI